ASYIFLFSSRRRHTRSKRDWSSDVCSSDLNGGPLSETSDRLEDWRTHCARTTHSDMIHRISLVRWTQPVRRPRSGRDLGTASARVGSGGFAGAGRPGRANGTDLGVRAIRRCCVDQFGLPAAPFSFEPADSLTE